MKVYNVVLIGCGHIGQAHISDIYYRDNIHITAVVDSNIAVAREFQRMYGAQFADTEYLPYLQMPEVDIVIIATPVHFHLPMLRDALAHGKHVLCEKPLAANYEDGRAFYELCKNAETKVSVGHILRHNATFQKVKELVEQGTIGRLKVARMVQNHHIMKEDRYHALMRDCSPLLDCGVHYYDLIQWISGGTITAVSGFGTRIANYDDIQYDYGVANLFLDNGVVGYYEAGWNLGISSANVKEFIGDAGSISVTLRQFRGEHTEEGDRIEVYRNATRSYETINVPCEYKPMYQQTSALIDLIEGRPSEAPSLDEVYWAFCVGLAADKAVLTGKKVEVTL